MNVFNLVNLKEKFIFYVTLIEMKNEFKQRLKQKYEFNEHWKNILKMIKKFKELNDFIKDDVLEIKFKHKKKLLYYIDFNDDKKRLCISLILEKKIF